MSRLRMCGGTVLAAILMGAGSQSIQAQVQDFGVPTQPAQGSPLPLGNPESHGVYTFGELLYLWQTWGVGNQQVAVRGAIDSTGALTGFPGLKLGSGREALNTNQFGKESWQPGFTVGIGYKLDTGTTIHASYSTVFDRNYHAGATLVPPGFVGPAGLLDTFITADVFNFPPQFAGPAVKTPFDDANGNRRADEFEGGNFYGIWNGAGVMDISFEQRFTQGEIGVRVPLFQTEFSRIYGLGGARFNWFFEQFRWRTVSFSLDGSAGPQDAAMYTNALSQRMYGPYVGCGHEIYLGNRFSVSSDLTGSMMVNVVKERVKYKLQDETIQNKTSRDSVTLVPSLSGNVNLWWYPIQGVQVRFGYNAWTFFNTRYMEKPIDFNYGSLSPEYGNGFFRVVHGVNFGVGLFF